MLCFALPATDRPKSIRNCSVIEVFWWRVLCCHFAFWGFCHMTWSDLLLFLAFDTDLSFSGILSKHFFVSDKSNRTIPSVSFRQTMIHDNYVHLQLCFVLLVCHQTFHLYYALPETSETVLELQQILIILHFIYLVPSYNVRIHLLHFIWQQTLRWSFRYDTRHWNA